MNKHFFRKNREKIAQQMEKDSLLILFAGKPPHFSADEYYHFAPNRNFYYLTGVEEDQTVLLVEKRGNAIAETLFIQKSDPDEERWAGKSMTEEEAKNRSGIERIMFLDRLESYFADLLNSYDFRILYLDLFRNDPGDENTQAHILANSTPENYPQVTIKDVYHQISDCRVIKQPEEIQLIKQALEITRAGIECMISHARSEIMEYEIEAHFDFVLKSKGKFEKSFTSIVASGKNATVLHYCSNNSQVKPGSLVLTDVGAACSYYCGDISRTFPIDGRFTERQRVIYSIVLKAQQAVMDVIQPGLPFKKLNETARKVLAKECKKIGLIEKDEELSRYYFHGVSHFLGLDPHDVGGCERDLEEGMVFTVEPGLYIEEEGIGIRIEDNVLVTKDGCENLSRDIIKKIEEIEMFMHNRT